MDEEKEEEEEEEKEEEEKEEKEEEEKKEEEEEEAAQLTAALQYNTDCESESEVDTDRTPGDTLPSAHRCDIPLPSVPHFIQRQSFV